MAPKPAPVPAVSAPPAHAASKPDWTKGEKGGNAPVIIIQPERSSSKGSLIAAGVLCAVALVFLAWQWAATQMTDMVGKVAPPANTAQSDPARPRTLPPHTGSNPGTPAATPVRTPVTLQPAQRVPAVYYRSSPAPSVTIRPVTPSDWGGQAPRSPGVESNLPPPTVVQPGITSNVDPTVVTTQAGPEIATAPRAPPVTGSPSARVIGRPGVQYWTPPPAQVPKRVDGRAPGTVRDGVGVYTRGGWQDGRWVRKSYYPDGTHAPPRSR